MLGVGVGFVIGEVYAFVLVKGLVDERHCVVLSFSFY